MIRYLTLVLCIGSVIGSRVHAELTAFWRNNPITPQAISDDPTLAGMQSWSVMVTNTEGQFSGAGLRAELPALMVFCRHPLGQWFRPSLAQQQANPALSFHTYVTQPAQSLTSATSGTPAVFGGFPDGAPLSFGGTLDDVPGTFSVSYGNPQGLNQVPGTFEIARLTFPVDALPTIHPASSVSYIFPDETIYLPTTIPEPASALFSLLACLSSSDGPVEPETHHRPSDQNPPPDRSRPRQTR